MSWIKDLNVLITSTGIDQKTGEMVDKIGSAVSTLATKLGVAAEHVYTVFAKQVVVESVTNVVIYIALLAIIGISIFVGKKYYKTAEWTMSGEPGNGNAWGFIASCAVSIIFMLIFCINFFSTISDTVTGFVNPEYKVIKEISEMVKEQVAPQNK